MIKNVIFDLGNVLINFNPMEYLHKKVSDKEKIQEIFEEIFLSEEWAMLDKGVITEEEAIERICSRSNGNDELIRVVMDNWYEMLTPIEDIVETLKRLKDKGYKVYYLSNFHMLAFENVTNRHEFFKYFDGGVVSFKEKLLKPEKDIYNKLIERYKINPKESVFIDDTEINIEGAKKLGFNTIHFKDNIDLKDL
ncbi:putative hydrolase of the HAD superfamily [Clostridium tetanomorphum]|uniref:HAD family phosphatase n=1 Tax=Clostridium tetanomorphum TaxID=1553 RepID=A0A923J087_CLOTT|nr:HAD family phosphatase [Clostridium tetanomorphum]KAJ53591.1 HAD superfamily hydrolase [Clostridium tetanomorphum DSM 665]MBC2397797.1 HAD family phosphatase [Clostridium tetanomorphum]MBP1864600.1 putative hydrolase of the HAD superfamily [Clostridium tetanomorphum]NRS84069.1 putative hydrolase of the HAD superfamily [Clostridium tetanomorphum]NRZ97283.1 putative hydrolase of the HAD superfamily [Clostridium tetanomorphum]